jgi:hypothetical protein
LIRYWQVVVLAVVSFAVSACGGGGEEGAATPSVTPGARLTPFVLGTPASTPIITDGKFEFPARGYAVTMPSGWSAHPNLSPGAGLSADGFLAPTEVEGVQPNISVSCESAVAGMSLEDYSKAKLGLVESVSGARPDARSTKVAGQDALEADYSVEDKPPAVDKTIVFFVTDRCGWTITLTVPLGQRAAYRSTLDDFLASFRLLS